MNSNYLPKGILFILCLIMGFSLAAQEPDTTKTQERINAAKARIEAKIADLEERFKRGELSESQFEEALDEAVEELAEAAEEAAEDLEDAFEDMEDVFIDVDSDSTKNKIKIKLGDRKSPKRTKSYFLFNLGPTDAFEQLENDDVAQPTFKPWQSWSGNFGLMFSTRIGGASSFAYINYGLLWKYIYLETKDDLQLSIVEDEPEYIPSTYSNSLPQSRLSRHSLIIPVQLRLAGKGANAFNLMIGGYGGIRLYAFQDLEFKSAIGEDVEMRLRDDYKTNLWQYGATAAIGQRWWQLYADYELSNLFQENPNYEYNVVNAGVQFFF
jgi:hypothetical protein